MPRMVNKVLEVLQASRVEEEGGADRRRRRRNADNQGQSLL